MNIKYSVFSCMLWIFSAQCMEKDEKNSTQQELSILHEKQTIDWAKYEKVYLNWYQGQALATKERWELLKDAIEKKEILFSDELSEKEYSGFLAYVGPFECEGQQVIYMYPSPQWMQSKVFFSFLRSNVGKAYTVGTVQEPDLPVLGWQLLEEFPKELNQPKETIFPDWQNKELFTLYSFDFKNPPQEQLPSLKRTAWVNSKTKQTENEVITANQATGDTTTPKAVTPPYQQMFYCTIN